MQISSSSMVLRPIAGFDCNSIRPCLQPCTPNIFRFCSTLSSHMILGRPSFLLPAILLKVTFQHGSNSSSLCRCPSHLILDVSIILIYAMQISGHRKFAVHSLTKFNMFVRIIFTHVLQYLDFVRMSFVLMKHMCNGGLTYVRFPSQLLSAFFGLFATSAINEEFSSVAVLKHILLFYHIYFQYNDFLNKFLHKAITLISTRYGGDN